MLRNFKVPKIISARCLCFSSLKFNHYTTLGVPKTATDKDIKKAFRAKSLKCHPDKFPGNKAKETEFKNLSEAYQVLSNKKSKADYDQKHANVPGTGSANPSGSPFDRPPHETYNRFNKRYRADLNNRRYRTEAKDYERNEDWHRIHQELNRRRYEAWEGRQADFSDFMHGRRGTDFKDFRKWYNEPASDFETGGKNKNWADGYYEKFRHGSQERMENQFRETQYQRFHGSYQRKVQEEKLRNFLRILLVLLAIDIIWKILDDNGLNPLGSYASQYPTPYEPSSVHDITVAEMVRRRAEMERQQKMRQNAEDALQYVETKRKD